MRFGAARGGQPRNDQKSELSSASDPFSEDIGRTPFELGDGFISGTDLLASIGEQADAAPPVTDADAFHFQSLSSAPGHSPAPASIGPENALEVSANGITSFLAREAADGGRIAELANALSDSQFAFVFRDDDFLRDRRNDEREPPLPDDSAGSGNEESDFDPAQDAASVHSVNLIHTLTADHVGGPHNPDGHDHHGGHHHHGDHDDHSHHDHDHLSAVEVALLEADFTAGAEGFTYADGTLGGAAPQPYAAGAWAGGTLGVTLGGLDNDDILDMSGGWTQSFTLTEAAPVTLSFDYSLTQGSEFEADEFSEVRYSLDGGAPVTVATITGDGNGGSAQTTGFQTYTTDLGTLSAGTHTVTFGGYNNKKTYNDEVTEVLIDNVLVTGDLPAATTLAIAPVSADKAEGDGGITAFTFEVTRSGDTGGATSVDYAVSGSGGNPAEAADFGGSFPSGTVTFAPGETTQTVTIDVAGDTDVEGDEGFTVTLSGATGGAGIATATATGTIQNDDTPPGSSVFIDADFATDAEGFTYADSAFGGAVPQAYADGAWASSVLGVTLGGIDNADILTISGGWTQSFTLAAPTQVFLSFDYNLTQTSEFESDEFSDVRYALDGGPAVIVAQITGDGNGGSAQTTGFQTYTTDLGTLAAGTHTITFGGFNNKKTYNDETTEVLIDNVLVTGDGPPPPAPSLAIAPVSADKAEGSGGTTAFTFEVTRSGDTSGSTSVDYAVTGSGGDPAEASDFGGSFPGGTVTFLAGETTQIVTVDVTADTDLEPDEGFTVTLSNATGGAGITTPTAAGTIQNDDVPVGAFNYLDADFSSGAEGFTYADSAFGGAVPQVYADGAWNSGVLGVTLGGIDDADILTISGGWSQSFTLAVPTALTLSFDYNLIQASGFESDEFSQVRYSVDGGASVVVALLTGDGDGGSAQTTGFQTFIADLGTLGAGTHTVTFGGFNNKKTFNDEVTEVLIDNVLVTGDAPPPPPAPSLAISPLSADKAEGSGGTTAFTFEVTRSGDTSGATSVDYAVSGSGGDPAEASDFGGSFPSGSVTFAAGETTKTVTVDVTADTDVEGDEGFTVTLSNASGGASISAPTATGTIQNDDAPPTTVLDEYFAGSENGTAGYDIWLDFEGTGWTVELQGAFIQAADYLTTVITGDIGGGGVVNGRVVDDLYMTAELTAIDGSGGILGQAGPTAIWTANDLSATGLMRFDTADAQNFANQGLWDDIVTHEMFHVVGFGTLWNFGQHGDLVSGSEYTGAAGLEAYRDTPGNGSATFIPVETEGGSGTAFSHWDEGALDNELMTGFIDNDGNPNTNDDNYLSEFSVMSLADLDYDVTYVDYPYDDGVSVG